MKTRLALAASAAALCICAGTVAAAHAPEAGAAQSTGLDTEKLQAALDAVHQAGVPGVFAEVRDADGTWRGASGVADLDTGRPVRPGMRQRVGSVTKTFTAAAIMQQVEQGRIRLDAPIGDYLPQLVPGDRGRKITVRMLLNHTSGIADYIPYAFPSMVKHPHVPEMSPQSIDDNRFRHFEPAELIRLGLDAPPATEPGAAKGVYSNTNYLLLGELLEHVSGVPAQEYITRNVIERAGLRHTGFPTTPYIEGPHPRMYESFFGKIDPPRDYSVYDGSWVGVSAGLVSTMADLDRFFAQVLDGRIVSPSSLTEMQRTGPVVDLDGSTIQFGLGLVKVDVGCGTFWGKDGSAWGAGTISLIRADGRRQMSVAINLQRWNKPDASGRLQPHPIDGALTALYRQAMCGGGATDAEDAS
ncbi:serine hydrolase domain-containing protein [Kitasatospora sp. NPDC048298]|uniref:serine hydrolase domain-containing protein n=1 Tax=Kitasatospora sp. NPDC048298 TaxID=3364049 RepID=UPI00371E634E